MSDIHLQQDQEGLFPASHSYRCQPGDTLNENTKNQHILMEQIENTLTFSLSYCMASLNTPVIARNYIYMFYRNLLTISLPLIQNVASNTPSKILYHSYS